jgi:hypothetical protein
MTQSAIKLVGALLLTQSAKIFVPSDSVYDGNSSALDEQAF